MPEPIFTIPQDSIGWFAAILTAVSLLTPILTALIIRARPDLSEKWRRRWSILVPVLLVIGPGWALMVFLGYANFDAGSFGVMLAGGLTAGGGKQIVYNELLGIWHDLSTPPAPPLVHVEMAHDPYTPTAPRIVDTTRRGEGDEG